MHSPHVKKRACIRATPEYLALADEFKCNESVHDILNDSDSKEYMYPRYVVHDIEDRDRSTYVDTSASRAFQSTRHPKSDAFLQTCDENTIEKRNAYIATNLPSMMDPFVEHDYEVLVPYDNVSAWLQDIGF